MRRVLLLLPLALLAAGCFGGGGQSRDSLTWGVAAPPASLDGAVAPDVESRRVIGQVFEGLVGFEPGRTALRPALAASWSSDSSGKVWTFRLRDGVQFQNGKPLTAAAVCANFERWFHLAGRDRDLDRSYYWQRVFGGFAGGESLYRTCSPRGETVELELTRPNSAFLSALPLPAFSIAEPGALEQGLAVGTGPFKLEARTRSRTILTRFDGYWGDKAKLKTLVFRVIPRDADRLQAIEQGDIDGFDFASPPDARTIEGDGELRLLERPAYDLGYLTINSAKPPMDKLLARQAVAYGLDRRALAASFEPRGTASVALQFQPPRVFGYAADAPRYAFRPAESRRLLRLAGLTLPVPVEFWYPSEVSRPYLPNPSAAFAILAEGLEQAGFRVIARTAPWDEGYLVNVDEGRAGHLNLVGWTGDFGDPNDFLGTFFSQRTGQFGLDDPKLFELIRRAAQEPVREARAALYRQANARALRLLPGVPLVHTDEQVVVRSGVQGYVTSPFGPESFAGVTVRN